MAKEPWEEKIIETREGARSKRNTISTSWITGVLSVFFIIIVAILFVVFYTSNRGGNKASETAGFASSSSTVKSSNKDTSTSQESQNSESATDSSSSTKESSSTQGSGETITVLAGEGAASIAARAGISVAKLQELNPDHMTLGYWYANPGDQVYIN
ncbi:SAG1386/EF1546 family surface-associated protein [Streptococcus sciuri]|uniref:LysM peptidoglycan-binding domain-containing protein n=1 Tax=Streptococcus sciuri TaxID=2973939 RepID=A0ABT2F5T4_9STRE|nr:SAG1386/EF1546 family surface-associated protein [Streptococcus sciuri]MCS4487818.1 LysM peptidoglycan-binding domain-containing protein [Streptococcus sciuri]